MNSLATLLALWITGQAVSGDSMGVFRDRVLGALALDGPVRAELDSGRPVVRVTASADSSHLRVVGAIRVDAPIAAVSELAVDAERFRGRRAGVTLGFFRDPPALPDLNDLPLDRDELRHLRRCEEGDCAWKLRSDFILRFRREIDWQSPDADSRAAALVREMLLTHVRDYLDGGVKAVGSAADRKPPQNRNDDYHEAVVRLAGLGVVDPVLRDRLLQGTGLGPGEAVFWSVERVRKPVISLTHQCAYRTRSQVGRAVGYRQVWANHYFRAAAEIVWVLGIDERTSYLVMERTTLVDAPTGIASGLTWGRIVGRARDRATELLHLARSAPEWRSTGK